MKLLQVVLCVVVGILGWGAKKSTQDNFTKAWLLGLTAIEPEDMNGNPTLLPASHFNAEADAKVYVKGRTQPTEEYVSGMIKMLASRTYEQRHQIVQASHRLFKATLDHIIDRHLTANYKYTDFGVTVTNLMHPLPEFLAMDLSHTCFKLANNKKNNEIIEVLLSLNNEGIRQVKKIFQRDHKQPLETFVRERTRGDGKWVINTMLEANREEGLNIKKHDAETLHRLTTMNRTMYNTYGAVIEIFTKRSYQQLRKTFAEFKKINGGDIETFLKGYSNFGDVFLSIAARARSRLGYFADVLRAQRSPLSVARVILGRCEIDLKDIKLAYHMKYKTTVTDLLLDYKALSPNLRKLLLQLATAPR